MRNGSVQWSISPQGQFVSAQGLADPTVPAYTFKGDTSTGLRWATSGRISLTAQGIDALIATLDTVQLNGDAVINHPTGGYALQILNGSVNPSIIVNSEDFIVDDAGELTFAGVRNDGTGKALCVKADKNIGTCTDAVGSGGTCTCA